MKFRLLTDWVRVLSNTTPCSYSDEQVRAPVIDSRLVQAGDIFFALPGKRTHGEMFLKEAADKGAIAAVVSRNYTGDSFGLHLIIVEDVYASLVLAAKIFLNSFKGKVIGITGSVGKTTVKNFLYTLLQPFCKVFASPLSYNSQITLPLSILLAEGDEDYLILEMGSSQPGNLDNLLDVVIPDVAVITTIKEQHALFYENGITGIFQEKTKIFLHEKTKLQLVPKDSSFFSRLFSLNAAAKKVSFGLFDSSADFFYRKIEQDYFVMRTPLGDYRLDINLPYMPAYINYVIAVSVFISLGFSFEQLNRTRPDLKLPAMRFEKICCGGITIINDAFNALPDSMVCAFEGVAKIEGRKIFILSQMNELGEYKQQGHSRILDIVFDFADIVFLLGEFWLSFQTKYSRRNSLYFYLDRMKMINKIKKIVTYGDVILLKGSRYFELEKLINHIVMN